MRSEEYTWPNTIAAPHSGTRLIDDEPSVEQIEAQAAAHARAIEETTERMLKTAIEAEQIGSDTICMLHQQGETISRIRSDQERIDNNLKASDSLLKGLETWSGAAANAISNWWYGTPDEKQATRPASTSGRDSSHCTRSIDTNVARSSLPRDAMRTGSFAVPSAQCVSNDNSLSQLSSIVSGLRAQADAMNAEINAQNANIDTVTHVAGCQADAMQQNAQRTRKLTGRSSK